MLTHKRIVAASLIILTVLASLMSIYPVKAVTYATPPYEDKRELYGGSNFPDAKANITDGHLEVWFAPLMGESAGGSAKVWSTFWCSATEITIEYSCRIKGWLKCAGFLSAVGADLWLLVENSDWETIYEHTIFHAYGETNYELAVDEPWQSPPPIVVSIPEAGYYRFCAQLGGKAFSGIGLAMCDFYTEEDDGAWVSMSINGEFYTLLSISASSGGTTDPAPATYTYDYGSSVTVKAIPDYGYVLDHWRLDGKIVHGYSITVTMCSDHTLTAYFKYIGGGGGNIPCPTLFAWNGNSYVDYGVIDIHNPSGEDVVREVPVLTEDVSLNNYKAMFRLREGWEGLNY
jgi:hypothetical protein